MNVYEFLNQKLIQTEHLKINYWDLSVVLLIIMGAFFLISIIKKWIRRSTKDKYDAKSINFFIKTTKISTWFISIVLIVIQLFGWLNSDKLLKYKLTTSYKFTVSVSDIIVLLFIFVVSFLVIKLLRLVFSRINNSELEKDTVADDFFRILRFLVWIISLFFIAQVIAKITHISKLLDLKLIKTDDFFITPFDILIALVIILITRLFILGLYRLFTKRISGKKLDPGVSSSIFQILKYVIWIVAATLILETVGVKVTILLAGSAALLVGVGLGLQQTFNDIFSGIILLFERNLKVGDVVETENRVGRVEHIGVRSSRIITRDNIEVLIPNSMLVTQSVINWSHMENSTRFKVKVGVAYGSDLEKVKNVLLLCATENTNVLPEPEPVVFFKNFGDSALEFELAYWTDKPYFYDAINSEIRFSIDKYFRSENIVVPFPQRDVHIKTPNN